MGENGESGRGTYVYGVVRPAGRAPAEIGSDEERDLRVVAIGDIGAIVRPIAGEPYATEKRALTAHARVLQEAMSWATVLPMRFGVVMPSEEVVREELLRARAEELARLLDAMEGRVEVNLKVLYRGDVVLREIVDENPSIARLRTAVGQVSDDASFYDRIRLGEMVVAAMRRKHDEDARRVLERLEPYAVDVSVDDTFVERLALRAAFLVEKSRLPDFDAAVDDLARELAPRMQFKYVGPLPPHSFVELSPALAEGRVK